MACVSVRLPLSIRSSGPRPGPSSPRSSRAPSRSLQRKLALPVEQMTLILMGVFDEAMRMRSCRRAWGRL